MKKRNLMICGGVLVVPATPKLSLSSDAQHLLTSEGERRLTDDDVVQLQVHMNMICRWAERVPETTKFFFVQWADVLVVPRIEGLTREQISIAAYLRPLHSQLCAIAVQVLWKSDQLIRTLCSSLNAGDLIVAATMARSLMESTAAFGCETESIAGLWRDRKRKPAADIASLEEFDEDVSKIIGQIMFGTRLQKNEQPETGIQRTNIVTFIKKAEKLSEYSGLPRLYEILCDTVHPSIGANRCFGLRSRTPPGKECLNSMAAAVPQAYWAICRMRLGKVQFGRCSGSVTCGFGLSEREMTFA